MDWVGFPSNPPLPPVLPGRAPAYAGTGRTLTQSERGEIEALVEEFSNGDPSAQDNALEELKSSGSRVTVRENGGALVTKYGETFGIGVGTTTRQASQNVIGGPMAIFTVSGAAHTSYLRNAVGDVYRNGQWSQLDPVTIHYAPNESIPHLVRDEIASGGGSLTGLQAVRVNTSLLAGFGTKANITYIDTLRVEATEELGNIPRGSVPTSHFLVEVKSGGRFSPFSATFALDEPTSSYEWMSQVPQFTEAQLAAAPAVSDSTYTQLPGDLPARIRDLALDVTSDHESPYAKARALESYLSTQYAYRFADGPDSEAPPTGRDPVDWFLFDHREGTCGVFSSAFVVMARSIGIPARVVSGWTISATSEPQDIKTDQAHQWAEVALQGVGWVRFEPTAPQGPQSRVQPPPETEQQRPDQSTGPGVATVTSIGASPHNTRRKTAFVVGGSVRTTTGSPVSGITVEIFINETKEHGGYQDR